MTEPLIFNGKGGMENQVFKCSKCGHWAMAPLGKTLCYVCEDKMEEMTAAKLRELVGRDDANILEIGANDGTHTLEFLKAFPKGKVTCYECDPRAIQKWMNNVRVFGRAFLSTSAISDRNEWADFYPSGGKSPGEQWQHIDSWDCSGSLLKDDQHTKECEWLTFGEPIRIYTHTLDSIYTEGWPDDRHPPHTVWWLDVQGAEAKVLRGGQKPLKHAQWVYLECHQKPYYHGQATFDELVALLPGFTLHSSWDGDNYLFQRVPG